MRHARGTYVMTMDADLQNDPPGYPGVCRRHEARRRLRLRHACGRSRQGR
jgi:hypothetical protein